MSYKDPEVRRQKKREYYLKNKARIIKQSGVWQKKNIKKRYEYKRLWCLANPEKCSEYGRRYKQTSAYYAELIAKKMAFVQEVKNKPCLDCGNQHQSVAMEFDHVPERGEKLFNISNGCNRSWRTLINEIKKCDVVCAICHRYREAARRRESAPVPQKQQTQKPKQFMLALRTPETEDA